MGTGDREWADFVEWYHVSHPRLSTAMVAIAGDVEVAREVTDEAFARAWQHWARVGSMESSSGWVYSVALNVLRRRQRRARLERQLLLRYRPVVAVPAPAGELWQAVAGLPSRQRTALVLRYVADLDEAEIGRVMGIGRSTVSSTLTAGRRRLGELIAEEHDERSAPLG